MLNRIIRKKQNKTKQITDSNSRNNEARGKLTKAQKIGPQNVVEPTEATGFDPTRHKRIPAFIPALSADHLRLATSAQSSTAALKR